MVLPSPTVLTAPVVNTSASTTSSRPRPRFRPFPVPVTVGVATPKAQVKTVTAAKSHETVKKPAAHAKVETPKKPTKPLTVDTKTHPVKAHTPVVEPKSKAQHPKASPTTARKPMGTLAAVAALQHLVLAKKGKTKGAGSSFEPGPEDGTRPRLDESTEGRARIGDQTSIRPRPLSITWPPRSESWSSRFHSRRTKNEADGCLRPSQNGGWTKRPFPRDHFGDRMSLGSKRRYGEKPRAIAFLLSTSLRT